MKFNPAIETYVNLATYRKDGREVRTPVWLAGDNGEYYVFSESKAGKVKAYGILTILRVRCFTNSSGNQSLNTKRSCLEFHEFLSN